jgi:hypothetical protein
MLEKLLKTRRSLIFLSQRRKSFTQMKDVSYERVSYERVSYERVS